MTALDRARAQAARRGHDRIATRHLLLGVLAARDSTAAIALQASGVDIDRLRRKAETSLPRSRRPADPRTLPYSANAQAALDDAVREARQFDHPSLRDGLREISAPGHPPVRSEHLLLALLAGQGGVGRVLRSAGASYEAVRNQVCRMFGIAVPSLPFLRIDPSAGAPVYQQIVAQIREAVAEGRLRPDGRLPTVRQLAAALDVAPGTTARAYQELEQLGIVVTDGPKGTRVARLRPPEVPRTERTATLVRLLRPVAVAASYLGASADEIRTALEHALRGIYPQGEPPA